MGCSLASVLQTRRYFLGRFRFIPGTCCRVGVVGASVLALFVLFAGKSGLTPSSLVSEIASRRPTGQPQLISVQPLPPKDGPMCEWVPAEPKLRSVECLAAGAPRCPGGSISHASPFPSAAQQTEVQERPLLLIIREPYPAFSSVAVDPVHDEVIFTDEKTLPDAGL